MSRPCPIYGKAISQDCVECDTRDCKMEYKNKINIIYGAKTKDKREENDFYATEPLAIYLAKDMFKDIHISNRIWECACGQGHMSKALLDLGYNVKSSDKINRGYGKVIDFLSYDKKINCDIVTNPPFKLYKEFLEKSMDILYNGNKICLFSKIQILEGKERKKLFNKYNPKYVYVYSNRISTAKNGDFEKYNAKAFCYCWLIFEKGFSGETILRWI